MTSEYRNDECKASDTEEPGAVILHAGICAGAAGQLAVLPRLKAQRKSLFFAPLRALRETSFSSSDHVTRIPRDISTRTDLCIMMSAERGNDQTGACKIRVPKQELHCH